MAIRRPVYYEKTGELSEGTLTVNLKEMLDSDLTVMRDYCNWVYSRFPVVFPSQQNTTPGAQSGLAKIHESDGTFIDTHMAPGTALASASSFPTGSLDGSSIYVVTTKSTLGNTVFDHTDSSYHGFFRDSAPGEVDNRNKIDYPLYLDSDGSGNVNLKSMTQQDMYDTFYANALDEQVSTDLTSGTFLISTATYATRGFDSDGYRSNPHGHPNHLGQNNNAILNISGLDDSTHFGHHQNGGQPLQVANDTIADLGYHVGSNLFLSDVTETNNLYSSYMYSKKPPFKQLVRFDNDSDRNIMLYKMEHRQSIIAYALAGGTSSTQIDKNCLASLVGRDMAAYILYKSPDKKVRYRFQDSAGGPGLTKGTAIQNTKLNGSGVVLTRYVHTDDYRAQDAPNGVPVNDGTPWYLKVYHKS